MTPKELTDKYPTILQKRSKWGASDQFPFECSEGWFSILDLLCGHINSHINSVQKNIDWAVDYNRRLSEAKDTNYETWPAYWNKGYREIPVPVEPVVATQIKEKFGGLRFYYTGGDSYIRGLVDFAESISYTTCETCGNPGTLKTEGWWYVSCEKHKRS